MLMHAKLSRASYSRSSKVLHVLQYVANKELSKLSASDGGAATNMVIAHILLYNSEAGDAYATTFIRPNV